MVQMCYSATKYLVHIQPQTLEVVMLWVNEGLTTVTAVPNLGAYEADADGRIVYVDLRAAQHDERFAALRANLVTNRPTERVLQRLTPINRGRLLVEIEDGATLALFEAWLRATATVESQSPAFWQGAGEKRKGGGPGLTGGLSA